MVGCWNEVEDVFLEPNLHATIVHLLRRTLLLFYHYSTNTTNRLKHTSVRVDMSNKQIILTFNCKKLDS
ncbi:MAG: hypothetical protein JWR18_2409 [Segetibacter sp.]|jgi:hypothetical protein|nr:hypothetical protein [Segetibacter sp.]